MWSLVSQGIESRNSDVKLHRKITHYVAKALPTAGPVFQGAKLAFSAGAERTALSPHPRLQGSAHTAQAVRRRAEAQAPAGHPMRWCLLLKDLQGLSMLLREPAATPPHAHPSLVGDRTCLSCNQTSTSNHFTFLSSPALRKFLIPGHAPEAHYDGKVEGEIVDCCHSCNLWRIT